MPLIDPFSAASRPLPPQGLDNPHSRPLQFAATLHPIDLNSQTFPSHSHSHSSTHSHHANGYTTTPGGNKLPKPLYGNGNGNGRRKEKEVEKVVWPAPQYGHVRSGSSASVSEGSGISGVGVGSRENERVGGRGVMLVGSDEWMQRAVDGCVDSAKGELNLNGLGLTSLSTKIADLRNLVTLTSSHSPKPSSPSFTRHMSNLNLSPSFSPSNSSNQIQAQKPTQTQTQPNVNELDDHQLSPGSHIFSANARSFSRTTSAPASSGFFNSLQAPSSSSSLGLPGGGGSGDRKGFERIPSGLRSGGGLLQSPTLTEVSVDSAESEITGDARETARGGNVGNGVLNALMASPSLPVSGSALSPLAGEVRKRTMGRSKTGAVILGGSSSKPGVKDLQIFASSNLLTSLPSALFEISNLTVLSLRSNKLTSIPAAIGELRNLKELNIGNNLLTELPSTILDLNLSEFHAIPNKFLVAPDDVQPSPSGRILGPLIINHSTPVPRLSTLCINILISPRPPSNLPPLLDCYEWPTPTKSAPHPLLSPETLRYLIPGVSDTNLNRIIQSLRSSAYSADTQNTQSKSSDPFPKSHKTLAPDDASLNPYYQPCKSPVHLILPQDGAVRPSRHLFLETAEERIEWVDFCGVKRMPVRWVGCSRGCLRFLEEEDDDGWSLDEEDE